MNYYIELNEKGLYDVWQGKAEYKDKDDYLHGANAAILHDLSLEELENLKRAIKKALKN